MQSRSQLRFHAHLFGFFSKYFRGKERLLESNKAKVYLRVDRGVAGEGGGGGGGGGAEG